MPSGRDDAKSPKLALVAALWSIDRALPDEHLATVIFGRRNTGKYYWGLTFARDFGTAEPSPRHDSRERMVEKVVDAWHKEFAEEKEDD